MSITISDIKTNLNQYIGDSSTDRITATDRYQAITEATVWLQEELGNDHMNVTYTLQHVDTVHYYDITDSVPDLFEPVDLRLPQDDHTQPHSRVSPREIAASIGNGVITDEYAIERRDKKWFLVTNIDTDEDADDLSDFDASDDGGGTWEADTSNSDAKNVTFDTDEFESGSASLNFDVDVSQSGNDRATIKNTSFTSKDLSEFEDTGSFIFEVYIPDTTNFSSVTFYFGSDSSNYYSGTATTDLNGNSFSNGWNTIKVNWADMTKTSSPDVSAVTFIRFDYNYTGSQTDDTDFRLDHLRVAKPTDLKFIYLTWNVGQDTGGSDITEFTADTDVPFFSGKYDQYRYPVAHQAAAIIFDAMRLTEESQKQQQKATQGLQRIENRIPSSRTPEEKSFKVSGLNFNS